MKKFTYLILLALIAGCVSRPVERGQFEIAEDEQTGFPSGFGPFGAAGISRTTLKSYFEPGDRPTSSQFTDLIDSLSHTTDDNVLTNAVLGSLSNDEVLTYNSTHGSWTNAPAGGSSVNSFETINASAGTDPVAESSTDTLNLTGDTEIVVTGDSSTDTITLSIGAAMTRDAEIDTIAELETFIGGDNLIVDTEIDTVTEINALTTDDDFLPLTGTDTITGLKTFVASGAGGLTNYDLQVGDTATPDYGVLRIGDSTFGRSSYAAGSLDIGGATMINNQGGLDAGNDPGIEFLLVEGGNTIRMAIPEAGAGNATAMVRSVTIAGPSSLNNNIVTGDTWSNYDSNVDFDTGTTGADLFVQDDLEVEGDVFLSETGAASGSIFFDSDDANQLELTAPNMTNSVTLTLPIWDGDANDFLQTDGSGNLTWAAVGVGSSSDTEILYNNSGVVDGVAAMTFDGTDVTVESGVLRIPNGTAAAPSLARDAAANNGLFFGSADVQVSVAGTSSLRVFNGGINTPNMNLGATVAAGDTRLFRDAAGEFAMQHGTSTSPAKLSVYGTSGGGVAPTDHERTELGHDGTVGYLAVAEGGTGDDNQDLELRALGTGAVRVTGYFEIETTAGITASVTQTQGNGALTSDLNEVSTVANVNDTVTLPTAAAGRRVTVINNGANTLQVFPASGDNLGLGVDTADTIPSSDNAEWVAYDATNWELLFKNFIVLIPVARWRKVKRAA